MDKNEHPQVAGSDIGLPWPLRGMESEKRYWKNRAEDVEKEASFERSRYFQTCEKLRRTEQFCTALIWLSVVMLGVAVLGVLA